MKASILALGLLAAAPVQAATVELGRYSFTATVVSSAFTIDDSAGDWDYRPAGPIQTSSPYHQRLTLGTTSAATLRLLWDDWEYETNLRCTGLVPCYGRMRGGWAPRPPAAGERIEIVSVGAHIIYDFAAMRMWMVTDDIGQVRGEGTDWMTFHWTETEWALTNLRVRDLTVPLPLPGAAGLMALAGGMLALLRRRPR